VHVEESKKIVFTFFDLKMFREYFPDSIQERNGHIFIKNSSLKFITSYSFETDKSQRLIEKNYKLDLEKTEKMLQFFQCNDESELFKFIEEKKIETKNLKFVFEIPYKSIICFCNVLSNICELKYFNSKGEIIDNQILPSFDTIIIDGCVNESGTLIFLMDQKEIKKFSFNGKIFDCSLFHDFKGFGFSISLNVDASLLCAVNDSTVLVFDLETEMLIFKFEVYSSILTKPLFSQIDQRILYLCDDHSIKIFSIPLNGELKSDPYLYLIQMIILKFEGLFNKKNAFRFSRFQNSRTLCESSNGKNLYFGCKEGIFQFKLLRSEKLENLRNLYKLKNILFQFQ
jgi:hypothetical protein